MRNEKVGVAIKKNFEATRSDPNPLQIFFVSSTSYEKHIDGYDERKIPLSLNDTGILSFRRMLSTLPAKENLNILRHHWRGNLTSVVDSLATWSSQSVSHKRLELRKVVEKPREVS